MTHKPAAVTGVTDSDQPDVDEQLPDRRPGPVEVRPKSASRSKLTATLIQKFGFDAQSASAIVRAIDDPDQALIQLKAPSEIGVHGGILKVITTRIRNGAAIPIPTNPRVSSRISFPAGGPAPSGGMEPLTVTERASSSATLEVGTASMAGLRSAMQVARDYISSDNDLRVSVSSQGVLLPITVIPVTFTSATAGEADRTVVCTIDGSSRLTAAMSAWGLTSEEVLHDLSSEAALTARRLSTVNLMSRDVITLSRSELAALRTQSLPANLIVGYEAFEPHLTLPAILDAYLGLIHVEPPKPWGDAAGQDKKADAVLDELSRLGRISDSRKRYLAGLMTPSEASASGFDSSLDGRSAQIFYDLDRTRNTQGVNRALRRIGIRNPKRDDRLEVATELAMRPYRRAVNELVRRNPRMALPSAMQRLKPVSWTPTDSSPTQLLAAARAELLSGADGPAGQELAVRAAFWLTRYNALQKSSRTDTRFADELLEDIRATDYGLVVLEQAILDGRRGMPPEQVREDGSRASAPDGSSLLVDDPWLRRVFPVPTEDDDSIAEDDLPEWDPSDELRTRIFAIRDEAETLHAKIIGLDEIEDQGLALVRSEGMPADLANEIQGHLDESRTQVLILRQLWIARNDTSL